MSASMEGDRAMAAATSGGGQQQQQQQQQQQRGVTVAQVGGGKITIVKGGGVRVPQQQQQQHQQQQHQQRTLSTAVRLLSPLTLPVSQQRNGEVVAQRPHLAALPKRPPTTPYHVPRGPATVASLSVPRVTTAPRAPIITPAPGWSTTGTQLRPGAVVYAPRPPRPHTLQVTTTVPRPTTLRPTIPQTATATAVVTRAVRPVNVPSPQRTPPPQMLQTITPIRTTAPKVVPLVQRNYQSAKVVGVALGVKPTISPRAVSSTYYYEVSSGINTTAQTQSAGSSTIVPSMSMSSSIPVHSLPVSVIPSHTTVTSFVPGNITVNTMPDTPRPPTSPVGPQRPSILRKKENESSPIKTQWNIVASPPPSPGGSTTVSAASSPELDDEDSSLLCTPIPPPQPSLPMYNNCSPRKKPRKQLLNSEPRGNRGGDCEFPSEASRILMSTSPPPAAIPPAAPPPPPPEEEKPPKRAMLSLGWTCGWRANALHFMRPSDVKRKEEKRPTVVELASQKHVLQKANGWKIHHLTAQMDDLIELESGVLQQATEVLKLLENDGHSDLNRVCELLKGNIQRSKIVCEGVAEARTNVLRIFQHKSKVSDILARQADKRCFKKQRNQY